MSKKKPELQQFEYRVRKTVDCIVMVEAATIVEADHKVQNAANWLDEQDVDCADWELRGRA